MPIFYRQSKTTRKTSIYFYFQLFKILDRKKNGNSPPNINIKVSMLTFTTSIQYFPGNSSQRNYIRKKE